MKHPDEFFTPRQIYSEIGSEAISLSAVYRNVAAMEQDGLLARHDIGRERAYRFTACCKGDIHIVCENCGKVTHLPKELASLVSSRLNGDGFTLDKSKTVLYGICSECNK